VNYRVNGQNRTRKEIKALKRQQAEERNARTKPEDRRQAKRGKA
jgi:hypothetical protein